ncbi:unnamed protein product [Acanthoscelides obtectus]|uniref:Uncharacterized protein n=1 Tax=Acanthoscelides obtectus TaxID=200917 RepID=A0A9P0P609_ACAOB|nr:unnamed protein product [Acanthoscelides obtectus]CAK1656398.1 hypothetical protein AOBTE_LOCUS19689 [Acanthoscelides obtectus]
MGGSNDALTRAFIQCEPLRETLKVLKATNVIIAAVPQWRCHRPVLNNIIRDINDQLQRICEQNGVQLLNLNPNLHHYYRERSNVLNNKGKRIICNNIKLLVSTKRPSESSIESEIQNGTKTHRDIGTVGSMHHPKINYQNIRAPKSSFPKLIGNQNRGKL